jgi:hypothetical protein
MEVFLFTIVPKDTPRPAPAQFRLLSDEETWSDAPELGALAPVYDQDYSNMGPVQEGLEAMGDEVLHLSQYMEVRVRNLHRMVAEYMNR